MLDLHAVSSGGSTGGLGSIGTIALGGDGQTVAGVPIDPSAVLVAWGGLTTIADTIEQLVMYSLDQIDPKNGEDFNPGASSLLGMIIAYTRLPYKSGKRDIQMDQNTAAANNLGFTIDGYTVGPSIDVSNKCLPKRVVVDQIFGALTAITWGTVALAPSNPLPNGKYAILGCWVNALTNYALIRFQHNDFGGKRPGFPVLDMTNTAVANAVLPKDPLLLEQGYQFVALSKITGKPCVPLFTVSNAGSGLTLEMISITADTPNVILNLAQVG